MSDSQHTHKPGDGHDHSHKLQPVHKHSHGGDSCCGSKVAAPAPVHAHEDSCCSSNAAAPALVQLSEKTTADARLSSFRIEAMDCPTEQTLIQNKLGKLSGVQQLEFNLINRVLGVTHNLPGTEPITEAIKSLGMHAEPLEAGVEAPAPAPVKNTGGRWRCPVSARSPLKSSTSPTPRQPGW